MHNTTKTNLLPFLKDFPHIQEGIELRWGDKEGREYLHDLVVNDPGRARQGFPYHVLFVLQELLDEHDKDFPKYKPKPDVWSIQ